MEVAAGTKQAFKTLQAGRALAAVLVAAHHSDEILCDPRYYGNLWHRVLVFGHSGVEFFFVLSGIVIYYAHQSDVNRPERIRSYLWKRFRRIYPIYWLVLGVVLVIYWNVPSTNMPDAFHFSSVAQSIALVHFIDTSSILRVGWTLFHEVMFYCLFGVAILNRRIGIILGSLWALGSIASLAVPPGNSLLAEYASVYHLLFLFGVIIVLVLPKIRSGGYVIGTLGFAGFIGMCAYDNLTGSALEINHVFYGAFAALALLGAMILERAGKIAVPKQLVFVGDGSYSIYLVHVPFIAVAAHVIYPIWIRMSFPKTILLVVICVSSVAFGCVFYQWVERPLLGVLRRHNKIQILSRDVSTEKAS